MSSHSGRGKEYHPKVRSLVCPYSVRLVQRRIAAWLRLMTTSYNPCLTRFKLCANSSHDMVDTREARRPPSTWRLGHAINSTSGFSVRANIIRNYQANGRAPHASRAGLCRENASLSSHSVLVEVWKWNAVLLALIGNSCGAAPTVTSDAQAQGEDSLFKQVA